MSEFQIFHLFQQFTIKIKQKLSEQYFGDDLEQSKHLAPIILKIVDFVKAYKS